MIAYIVHSLINHLPTEGWILDRYNELGNQLEQKQQLTNNYMHDMHRVGGGGITFQGGVLRSSYNQRNKLGTIEMPGEGPGQTRPLLGGYEAQGGTQGGAHGQGEAHE